MRAGLALLYQAICEERLQCRGKCGHEHLRGDAPAAYLPACIADPGNWGIADGVRSFAMKLGARPAELAELGDIAQPLLDRMWSIICGDRKLRWNIVQRGFWVNGASDLRGRARHLRRERPAGGRGGNLLRKAALPQRDAGTAEADSWC
jgi:hypothetical protein